MLAMIDIGGTMVMVTNQKKSLEFYRKLGFEKHMEMKTENVSWLEVAPKNSKSTLSLFTPTRENMQEVYEEAKNRIGKDTFIWLNTNDIKQTVKELREKEVEVSDPIKVEWGGMCCVLKDPDGNQFTLIELPKE